MILMLVKNTVPVTERARPNTSSPSQRLTPMPGYSHLTQDRSRFIDRCWAILFVNVSVLDKDSVSLRAQKSAELFGDQDRTVMPARTSYRHRQVGLTLSDIL